MDDEEELNESGFQMNDDDADMDPLETVEDEDSLEDPDDRYH
ncbi:MAG: hypothetical protein WAN61_03165 [Minisyncoccia bacterium]